MDLKSLSTEELVALFGDERQRYWDIRSSQTLKDSRRNTNRKDIDQEIYCLEISDEISSRPLAENLKLRLLLSDLRPGVKLDAASELEDIALEDAVVAFRDLIQRPMDSRGVPDIYAAQAGLALGRLFEEGKILEAPEE